MSGTSSVAAFRICELARIREGTIQVDREKAKDQHRCGDRETFNTKATDIHVSPCGYLVLSLVAGARMVVFVFTRPALNLQNIKTGNQACSIREKRLVWT